MQQQKDAPTSPPLRPGALDEGTAQFEALVTSGAWAAARDLASAWCEWLSGSGSDADALSLWTTRWALATSGLHAHGAGARSGRPGRRQRAATERTHGRMVLALWHRAHGASDAEVGAQLGLSRAAVATLLLHSERVLPMLGDFGQFSLTVRAEVTGGSTSRGYGRG